MMADVRERANTRRIGNDQPAHPENAAAPAMARTQVRTNMAQLRADPAPGPAQLSYLHADERALSAPTQMRRSTVTVSALPSLAPASLRVAPKGADSLDRELYIALNSSFQAHKT